MLVRPHSLVPLVCIVATLAVFGQETGRLRSDAIAAHVTQDRTVDQSPSIGQRLVVRTSALPGIDRGLRAIDMPRKGATASPRIIDRTDTPNGRYAAGRVIVKFRSSVDRATCSRVLAQHGAALRSRPTCADFDVAAVDPSTDVEALARDLSARSDVEYAQAAYRMHPSLTPNDPLYSRQWNFTKINMEQAWDINQGASPSIVVAVLDTGVAFENTVFRYQAPSFTRDGTTYPALGTLDLAFAAAPDLASSGRFVSPHDFIWNDDHPVDLDGHGTHVSGTIGQLTNNGVGTAGIAFNVHIMPVKVLDSDWDDYFNSPEVGTDDTVARGIRYAVDNGANVLNMSFGRNGPPAPVVESAIRYAVGKGAFIAVAGGNDFEDGNPTEVVAEIASRVQGAVAVSAVGPDLNRAYYSTTGAWVELAAPGGAFRSFGSEGGVLQQTLDLDLVETFDLEVSRFTAPRFDAFAYFYFAGTSMATAHISGIAALLIQQGIKSPAAIEAAMERFATDRGAAGRDNEYGFGLINPRQTLRGLGVAR